MSNGIIAIFDSEAEYALKLAEYFNLKSGLNYSVSVFTDYDSLKLYLSENTVDILLISEDFCQYAEDFKSISNVFILTESGAEIPLNNYASLYKYQPSDCILRDVMSCYAAASPPGTKTVLTSSPAKITGVYSPVKRCGKTSFSLAYGCILSLTGNCLYINLEEYPGFSFFIDEHPIGDLSDLLYFYRQNPANIQKKLTSLAHTYHNLNYIPPMQFSYDIKNLEGEDLTQFILTIAETCGFDNIILDISDSVKDISGLLSICSQIYMPTTNDAISVAKIDDFFRNISTTSNTSIKDKTEIITLPYADATVFSDHHSSKHSSDFMEKLLFSEFGTYVRNLIA